MRDSGENVARRTLHTLRQHGPLWAPGVCLRICRHFQEQSLRRQIHGISVVDTGIVSVGARCHTKLVILNFGIQKHWTKTGLVGVYTTF